MPGQVIDSAPGGAAAVVAPSSQDVEAIRREQDAAWDDNSTDVDAGEVKPDGVASPASEVADTDVIVDKPAIGAVVPAPKPGAAAPAAKVEGEEPAAGAEVVKKEGEGATPVAAAAVVTPEQKTQNYWAKLSEVHPTAYADTSTPKFKAWFETLSPADKAAAANLDKPEESIKLMGKFYADDRAGKITEPQPPAAPTAMDVSEFLKANNLAGRKIKLANGTETTLGDMAKPEEFGDLLAAMGAIGSATEEIIMSKATKMIESLIHRGVLVTGDQFAKLVARLGDKDLSEKVPDASTVTADPKFQEFVQRSKLFQNAWASGDVEQRTELINLFKAESAKTVVTTVAAGQKKVNAAKNAVHAGTLRGGAPGAPNTGDDGKSTGEIQDQAWDTPIDVEGQKV